MTDEDVDHLKQRTLVIRHAGDHRFAALLKMVSPSNKDREQHVNEFVEKARSSVKPGLHFVWLDLLPSGRFDPREFTG